MTEVAGGHRSRGAARCGLSRSGHSYASLQAAETALFAAGNEVDVPRKAPQATFLH
jgi:hypothetical protein